MLFRPKPMKKVRLFVLKSHAESLVKELHQIGLLHIKKTKVENLEEGRPLPSFDEISKELLHLRRIFSIMKAAVGKESLRPPELIEGHDAINQSQNLGFDERLEELHQQISILSENIKTLENEALMVDKVLHFKEIDFSKLKTRNLDYKVGEVSLAKIPQLNEKLEKTPGHTALVFEEGYKVVLVVFEKKAKNEVEDVLTDVGFIDIDLPKDITTPLKTIEKISTENEVKKKELHRVEQEIAKISRDHIQKVKDLLYSLEVESERAEIAQKFSSSKYSYVIEGWILEENLEGLKKVADKYADVILEEAPLDHDELPPTVLDNPKLAKPIQFLTESYSLPNYFELDPTIPYFICLPIIYGMMVGDVLYGLASIGIGYWLMQKFKDSYVMSNVSKIWFLSGFPTIIFGVIFDEWGGMSHIHLLQFLGNWLGIVISNAPLYVGFHRMSNIFNLVLITIAVGVLHLAFGFVLGAINEWNHNKKHALAKIAWLGVEAALVLSLLGGAGVLGEGFLTAGLTILVISIIGLVMTEGMLGVIELPGLVGNILSYTRIAAIGIVGVIIAELLNEFLVPVPSQGLMLIVFIPAFIGLHLVNAFIAMFESLIQGGRLNIVEFRSKFLHGGGQIFNPFKMR